MEISGIPFCGFYRDCFKRVPAVPAASLNIPCKHCGPFLAQPPRQEDNVSGFVCWAAR